MAIRSAWIWIDWKEHMFFTSKTEKKLWDKVKKNYSKKELEEIASGARKDIHFDNIGIY